MKLYHTSTVQIREPDLLRGRKNADFGQGFYLAPKYTQMAVKTEKALRQLRWLRSERITKLDPALREAEQEAYALALAKVMESIAGKEHEM